MIMSWTAKNVVYDCGEAAALQMLVEHVLPGSDEEPYHLEYELIEGYAENRLDRVDLDTAKMHLAVCGECAAEVHDLRESLARHDQYQTVTQCSSWWVLFTGIFVIDSTGSSSERSVV